MDKDLRKALIKIGVSVLGFALIGTLYTAFYKDEPEKRTNRAAAAQIEAAAADTENACEAAEFIDFRKAEIDEYDMSIDGNNSASTKKTDKSKKISDFSMKMPEDETVFYDPQPESLNYTKTRSVADEYYTVYDIISHKTVTMNAYELLCRMVYSEIGSTWKPDAIKAQTVAAYSYLRFNETLGLIPKIGLKAGYPKKIERCVNAVEGQCVYYNGSIANAVYSASSAGYSTESENVWGVYYPYLRAVVSAYDEQDPNFGEKTQFTVKQIKTVFQKRTNIKLSDNVEHWFEANAVFSGRYIGGMTVDGHTSCAVDGVSERITGETIRNLLDLKSNAFTIEYKDGVFIFTTYGYGHGVGMSQWGACLYAENGYTYDQILRHYYKGVSIKLSDVSKKAVARGKKSEKELEKEINESQIVDNIKGSSGSDKNQETSKNNVDKNSDDNVQNVQTSSVQTEKPENNETDVQTETSDNKTTEVSEADEVPAQTSVSSSCEDDDLTEEADKPKLTSE